MVTINRLITRWYGISTDDKPTRNVRNGSRYYEMDTCRLYLYDEEDQIWRLYSAGRDPDSDRVGSGLVGYMKLVS